MAWANNNANQETKNEAVSKPAAQVENTSLTDTASTSAPHDVELAKARAVCDELLQRGANIAESYEDYLRLGFALAEGLGSDGHDIYHDLCAQSTKYRQADCERKWQECLKKGDGRTTIASYYDMARQAGVDLSAVSRQFPQLPQLPQLPPKLATGALEVSKIHKNNTYYTNNHEVSSSNSDSSDSSDTNSLEAGGVGGVGGSGGMTFSDTFSDKLDINDYPELLREVALTQNTAEEQDKMTLGALVTLSGKMPNVKGRYGDDNLYPPLYLILSATSGRAHKGAIDKCRQLLMPIEYELQQAYEREKADYDQQMTAWEVMKSKERTQHPKPQEPVRRKVFIPANSSATNTYQELSDNDGEGIIFDTEADTLTQALSQDYGNYSDGLRKAFHHEPISYGRRTEHEYVYIDKPRLAVLLTCTPLQIPQLLPSKNIENGLANRFFFFLMCGKHGWRSPWVNAEGVPLADCIYNIGKKYYELYHALLKHADSQLEFTLTPEQRVEFDNFFSPLYEEQTALHGESIDAFIFRLGVTTFRIAMVLTVLRCYEHSEDLAPEARVLVCRNVDFHTALTIAETLVNHTAYVYNNMLKHEDPAPQQTAMTVSEKQLFDLLEKQFTTKEAQAQGAKIGMTGKVVEHNLSKFTTKYMVVRRIKLGVYEKLTK